MTTETPIPKRTKTEIEKDMYQAYAQMGEMQYRQKVYEAQLQQLAVKISGLHSEQPLPEEAPKVVEAEVVQ